MASLQAIAMPPIEVTESIVSRDCTHMYCHILDNAMIPLNSRHCLHVPPCAPDRLPAPATRIFHILFP